MGGRDSVSIRIMGQHPDPFATSTSRWHRVQTLPLHGTDFLNNHFHVFHIPQIWVGVCVCMFQCIEDDLMFLCRYSRYFFIISWFFQLFFGDRRIIEQVLHSVDSGYFQFLCLSREVLQKHQISKAIISQGVFAICIMHDRIWQKHIFRQYCTLKVLNAVLRGQN